MSNVDSNQDATRRKHMKTAEELAEDTRNLTANGNNYSGDQDSDQNPKTGGAERGGPGADSAMKRQPPDATRPSVDGPDDEPDDKADHEPQNEAEPIQGSGGLVNPVNGPDREIR